MFRDYKINAYTTYEVKRFRCHWYFVLKLGLFVTKHYYHLSLFHLDIFNTDYVNKVKCVPYQKMFEIG